MVLEASESRPAVKTTQYKRFQPDRKELHPCTPMFIYAHIPVHIFALPVLNGMLFYFNILGVLIKWPFGKKTNKYKSRCPQVFNFQYHVVSLI